MNMKSVNINDAGKAIVDGWKTRAGNVGMSIQSVCGWAEQYLRNNHGDGKLKPGSLNQVLNVWRYTPPAALLLVDALKDCIWELKMERLSEIGHLKLATKKELERRVAEMEFNTPIVAIRYYLAIEHVLYEKEAAFDHATAVKTADV